VFNFKTVSGTEQTGGQETGQTGSGQETGQKQIPCPSLNQETTFGHLLKLFKISK
jgi:hypothetical protein